MGIYFRDRKNALTMDAGFDLFDGDQFGDKSGWLVGDEVSFLFTISSVMADQINENMAHDSGVIVHKSMMDGESATVHIPCVVVKRSHACSWKSIGRFQNLGSSVTLEAETGIWEDVLKWVAMGTVPPWIETT